MFKPVHISSYRLAFWHAPQRARHEDFDVFSCIFCQYSEGVARMQDIVAHLREQGFPITGHEARSFTLESEQTESTTGNHKTSATARLSAYVSGKSRRIPV